MGEPWSLAELCARAEEISGKLVGQNWHRKFERRHPELCSSAPQNLQKLDPKRAQHFNELIINGFQMDRRHFLPKTKPFRRNSGSPPSFRSSTSSVASSDLSQSTNSSSSKLINPAAHWLISTLLLAFGLHTDFSSPFPSKMVD